MTRHPRILIVDDYASGREALTEYLEYSGFEVLTAENGRLAVDLARRELPDLIFMDLSLPELSGWDATRILKEDEATSGIPIVALTAHALARDLERAREVGCDDVITKPAHPRDLVAAANRILDLESESEEDSE